LTEINQCISFDQTTFLEISLRSH